MSIQAIAIITPAPGKYERFKTVFTDLAEKVHANEPDVLSYQVYEQVGKEGVNMFIVQETYKNQAAYEAHLKTEYFLKSGKIIAEENLMGAPPDIKTLKPFVGFTSR